MTTKDKLLHIAAEMGRLKEELRAIGRPVSEGGAGDISMAASHSIGVVMSYLFYGADKLMKVAASLS